MPEEPEQEGDSRGADTAGGFSLHAGLDIQPHHREKLERLCRYVSRPAVAVERLALISFGQVRYQLKTAYRDGTTHIVLEPLDLMARLAALVPCPANARKAGAGGIQGTHTGELRQGRWFESTIRLNNIPSYNYGPRSLLLIERPAPGRLPPLKSSSGYLLNNQMSS